MNIHFVSMKVNGEHRPLLDSYSFTVYYYAMPRKKEENQKTFLDGIDERLVTREIWDSVNQLYGKISHMVNFKYNLILYRLIKKGYVKLEHLEEITGLTKQRIYQIINSFEEREVERQNE